MKFSVQKKNHTTIFNLHETKLDAKIAPMLKAEFLLLCKPKTVKLFILDLSEVKSADVDGLSALLIAQRVMREHEADLRIANVHKKTLDLMRASMLEQSFAIYKTLEEALEE